MAQQTAVDYLFEQLWETPKDKLEWYAILSKAKQMEKEQIMKAYVEGINLVPCDVNSTDELDAEKYYHKTFGK